MTLARISSNNQGEKAAVPPRSKASSQELTGAGQGREYACSRLG